MDPSIHWKTGTSFGYRDAWSVGSDERYTIAVWLGNLDRKPSRYLVGAPLAGPLLVDLFDALGHQDRDRLGDAPPGGMTRIEICSFSGYLPGPGCEQTEETWAPRKSISVTLCPFHRRMWVRDQERIAYPQACAPKDAQAKSVLVLPAQVREFSAQLLPEAYTLAPQCEARNAEPLRIISPASQTIVLIPGMSRDEQELGLRAKAAEGTELSWFINGQFLGSSAAENPLWWKPEPGLARLVVMDAAGRKARKLLKVR
jgi:penicillin-binding protein 1C